MLKNNNSLTTVILMRIYNLRLHRAISLSRNEWNVSYIISMNECTATTAEDNQIKQSVAQREACSFVEAVV